MDIIDQLIAKKEKMNILFVCSSNVCRSPYAQFLMMKLAEEDKALAGKIGWIRSSAVFNQSKKIHFRARRALLAEGIAPDQIDSHSPTLIHRVPHLFESASVIIGMNRAHGNLLPEKWRHKYLPLSLAAGREYKGVPDPFLSLTQTRYNKVMLTIKNYLYQFVDRLI